MEAGGLKRGFTLIELLVVISIIAIISVVAVSLFTNANNSANDAKRKADINAIAKALEANYDPTASRYDTATITSGTAFAGSQRPVPPEGGNYSGYLSAVPAPTGTTGDGFRICTSLGGASQTCDASSSTCFCIDSTRAAYNPDSSTVIAGFEGGGGPTSTPGATDTPVPPTNTPAPTDTPGPTATPIPTATGVPTATPTITPTPTTVVSCAIGLNIPGSIIAGTTYSPAFSESSGNPAITSYAWTVTAGTISGPNINSSINWQAPGAGNYAGSTIHLDVNGGAAGCDYASSYTVVNAPTPTPTPPVDADGDGVDSSTDCNDNDADVFQNVANLKKDQDQDGHIVGTTGTQCVGISTVVSGRTYYKDTAGIFSWLSSASLGTDCYDKNANARSTQASWFTITRGTSVQGNDSAGNTWNSFDYNCNSIADLRYTTAPPTLPGPACYTTIQSGTAGWTSGSVPACGVSATFRRCVNYTALATCTSTSCVTATEACASACAGTPISWSVSDAARLQGCH